MTTIEPCYHPFALFKAKVHLKKDIDEQILTELTQLPINITLLKDIKQHIFSF